MIPAFTIIFKRPAEYAPLGAEANIGIKFPYGQKEYGGNLNLGTDPSSLEFVTFICELLLQAEDTIETLDKQEE